MEGRRASGLHPLLGAGSWCLELSRVEGCSCGRARPAAGGAQGLEAAPLVCPETLVHCLLWVACVCTSVRASALLLGGCDVPTATLLCAE